MGIFLRDRDASVSSSTHWEREYNIMEYGNTRLEYIYTLYLALRP